MSRRSRRRTATPQRAGRAAGTRARVPQAEPARPLRLVVGVGIALGLAGLVAFGPEGWHELRTRSHAAPFLVETLAVRGLERVSPDEVRELAALNPGAPLLDLEVDAAAERLRGHPWIADATVVRWPPDTVLVAVREHRALAVTRAGDPARPHAVNADGIAFAPASDADAERLVEIVVSPVATVGEPDPRLAEGLRLAATLPERGLGVPGRITLGLPERDASAELILRGFPARVRIERAEAAQQLDRLATLLAAGLPRSAEASSIDLRFADRAVLAGGPRGGP